MTEAVCINSKSVQILETQYTWSRKFLKLLEGLGTSSGMIYNQGYKVLELVRLLVKEKS